MRRLLADGLVTGHEERDASGTVVNVVVTGLTEKGRQRLIGDGIAPAPGYEFEDVE